MTLAFFIGVAIGAVVGIPAFIVVVNLLDARDWNRPGPSR